MLLFLDVQRENGWGLDPVQASPSSDKIASTTTTTPMM
jgi:hypothetical protein